MNDLALIPSASLPVEMSAVPPELEAIIGSDARFERTAAALRDHHAGISPAARAAIPLALVRLENSLHPAGAEAALAEVQRLAAHYWTGDVDARTWAVRLADYPQSLGNFPADILVEGLRKAREDLKHWPKLAELLAILKPLKARREAMIRRLKALDKLPDPVRREVPDETSRARMSGRMKALQTAIKTGKPYREPSL